MLKMGTWWLKSEKDPRWNFEAKGHVGLFGKCQAAIDKEEELKKELGEPPDDLEFGYMKD